VTRTRTRTDEERREQRRAAQARFREKHRERLNAKRREAYWRDIDKTREQQQRWNRTYKAKHREEERQRNASYRAKNRDRLNANLRAWRQANLDEVRAYDRIRSKLGYATGDKLAYLKEWRRRNPEKARASLRASFHKRRSQIAADSFTAAEWLALASLFDSQCAYCGRKAFLTVDHRMPLSRGGRNLIENVLPCCKSCNSRKHDKAEVEFRAQLRSESLPQFRPLFAALAHGPTGLAVCETSQTYAVWNLGRRATAAAAIRHAAEREGGLIAKRAAQTGRGGRKIHSDLAEARPARVSARPSAAAGSFRGSSPSRARARARPSAPPRSTRA
jgi:5-methylcytosine-specific restriction endonuclease McrA